MNNVLILGANGRIAQWVVKALANTAPAARHVAQQVGPDARHQCPVQQSSLRGSW